MTSDILKPDDKASHCCATCKYVARNGNTIECRRYPPKIVDEYLSAYPTVQGTWCCGLWESDEENDLIPGNRNREWIKAINVIVGNVTSIVNSPHIPQQMKTEMVSIEVSLLDLKQDIKLEETLRGGICLL